MAFYYLELKCPLLFIENLLPVPRTSRSLSSFRLPKNPSLEDFQLPGFNCINVFFHNLQVGWQSFSGPDSNLILAIYSAVNAGKFIGFVLLISIRRMMNFTSKIMNVIIRAIADIRSANGGFIPPLKSGNWLAEKSKF